MATSQLDTIIAPHLWLAEVATCLAADGDIVRKSVQVLDCVTRSTGASECSLWLGTPGGLIVAARAGSASTPSADLAPAFESGDADLGHIVVRRLVAGSRRLGSLVLRIDGGVSPDVATAFTAVAHMLAPALAWAEQARAFVAEADRRTRQLEEERRLIHQVVDSLPVSLYVVDRDYRITVWNRKREAGSQGVSREHALGKTLFEILHRAPAEKLRLELDDVFTSGRIQQFTMESRATGESRSYRITKIPMQAVEGEPFTHVITIGEDVTDTAATQARVAQSEQLASLGRLAAAVMREAVEPLATIGASADTLLHTLEELAGQGATVPDHATAAARTVATEAARCASIIGGVMDVSQGEAATRSPVQVPTLVEQAIATVQHLPAFKRLTLRPVVDGTVPSVQANPGQLVQVMIGMLHNAAEAMESGGTVTIRSRPGPTARDAVILEIIDEGRGIARADQPHIFEPFHSTKGPGRGTGLGLSICHSIVTAHGGRIEVDSAVGAGSTFRILLPGAATP